MSFVSRRLRSLATGATFILAFLSPLSNARPADRDDVSKFLAGLRQRRLFSLAEHFCHQQLDTQGLSLGERAMITVELMRSYADHARHTPHTQREAIWTAASQAASDFLTEHADSPQAILVRSQAALTDLARGELQLLESQIRVSERTTMLQAARQFQSAAGSLQSAEEAVGKQLRRQQRSVQEPVMLGDHQLRALRDNLRYQQARAHRFQADCFDEDSNERAFALTQAVELFESLAEGSEGSLAWKCQLRTAACRRMQNRLTEAQQLLDRLESRQLPQEFSVELKAEMARLHLAQGESHLALSTLEGLAVEAIMSPELELVRVECHIALREQTGREPKAPSAQAQDTITQLIGGLEERHGPYWSRRAQALLAASSLDWREARNLELLVGAADGLYAQGQFDRAIAGYENAAKVAEQSGLKDRRYTLLFKAALIEYQRDRHTEALQRFQQLAIWEPEDPRASEAHLMAVFSAGALAGQSSSLTDQYADMLNEHLRRWPTAETADTARWWLGRFQRHRGDWPAALSALEGVTVGFGKFDEVLDTANGCYREWLAGMQVDEKPAESIAKRASHFFEDAFRQLQLDATDSKVTLRKAALLSADYHLRYSQRDVTLPSRRLTFVIDQSAVEDTLRKRARALSVVALAMENRYQEARTATQRLEGVKTDDILDMLQLLSELARQSSQTASMIGPLQLQVITLLESDGRATQGDLQSRLRKTRAEALANAGRTSEALATYEELVSILPDDVSVRERYATLLLDQTQKEAISRAIEQWRKIERRSPPNGPRWYRAKYNVALGHLRAGNKQQAANIIQVTGTLHPGFGGPESEKAFMALLKLCK